MRLSRRTMLSGIGVAAATSGTSIAAAAGGASDATRDEIAEGKRVKTTAPLVTHRSDSLYSRSTWTAPEGAAGYVREGPSEGYWYTWWKVGFNAGHEGWCVGKYLTTAPVNDGSGGGGGGSRNDNTVQGVPYRSQRDNYYTPSGSCQNTCISMLLGHYGLTVDPDSLTERWGTDDGQTPSGAEYLFETLAWENGLEVRANSSQSTTMDDIEAAVDADTPVMTFGWFTPSGHIVVVVGYDDDTIYAHDPYGTWNERYYGTHTAGGGDTVAYDRDAFEQAVAPDGYVWTVIPE
jgi:hypothetical protein